jgi:hypothetical protein
VHMNIFSKMVMNNFNHFYANSKYNPEIFVKYLDSVSARTRINLETTKTISFNSFLQRIVQAEYNINGESCSESCEAIKKKEHARNGCFGELRDCEKLKFDGSVMEVFFSVRIF